MTRASLRNANRFDVSELLNPFGAKFAAVTGSFDPAERHTRIGRDHRIYEHHSAFQFVRKEFLLGRLVCPNAGAEPKCGIVCNRDRDRKSTRLNSSHATLSRMPCSA